MNFNDEQTPDEISMHKMNQEYASKVSVAELDDNDFGDASKIFWSINWDKNNNLLRLLANKVNNSCEARFVRELLNLSESDFADLSQIYPRGLGERVNPTMSNMTSTTLNGTLREYIRAELQLLSSLINIRNIETNLSNAKVVYNIIQRRIEALGMIAELINSGIFG